jgi:hypothetical protein
MKRYGILLALGVMATACGIEGNGNIVSEERYAPPFDSVELSMDMETYLEISDTYGISVTCDSNLLSKIDTDVRGGKVEIDGNIFLDIDDGDCFVTVRAPSFYSVEVRGSGDLYYDVAAPTARFFADVLGSGSIVVGGIDSDQVDVLVIGSGSVTLSGVAGNLQAETEASGDIWASQLLAETVKVTARASGESLVFASQHVTATTHGSGDITVYGDPLTRDADSHGSGRVRFE